MSNNPFEFMQSFLNPESIAKSMKGTPNIDFSSFANMVKNNADAITATNQMASESMQSIMKRGSETFQKNAKEMFNSIKEAVSAGDIEQITSCQQKYLKSTIANNITNTKEILDITSKSSMEILDAVGKNMSDNINKTFTKTQK